MAAVSVDEILRWAGIANPGAEPIALMTACRAAAIAHLESRTTINYATTPDDADNLALMMMSARLYKRRTSAEGVGGFGDLGVFTVRATDVDVEALISSKLKLTGFA